MSENHIPMTMSVRLGNGEERTTIGTFTGFEGDTNPLLAMMKQARSLAGE